MGKKCHTVTGTLLKLPFEYLTFLISLFQIFETLQSGGFVQLKSDSDAKYYFWKNSEYTNIYSK